MAVDLRKNYGVWDRCGNTRFWSYIPPEGSKPVFEHTYVNPFKGILIQFSEHPPGSPAYYVLVSDSSLATDKHFLLASASLYLREKNVINEFFENLRTRKMSDEDEVRWFLKSYKAQGARIEEGGGVDQPSREEVLAAIASILGAIGSVSNTAVGKVILKDEIDEFLGDYGILEC